MRAVIETERMQMKIKWLAHHASKQRTALFFAKRAFTLSATSRLCRAMGLCLRDGT